MLRLLIADDHSLVRRGIVNLVSESPNMEVAGEAETAEQTIDLVSRGGIDIVILDIALPDRNGIDVLKEIRAIAPEVQVIMLSMYPEDRFAVRSIIDGASAYISKRSADSELVAAIKTVASGRAYISERVAEDLARFVAKKSVLEPHEALASREFQVLLLLGSGHTVSDTARTLKISRKTVTTYRARLLDKMNFSTNAQLVKYCAEHHLLLAGPCAVGASDAT